MNQSVNRLAEMLSLQEKQFSMRLEDLEGRLQELTERLPMEAGLPDHERLFCSEMANCELDYAIPSDLETIRDVLSAIQRTKDFLWNVKCELKVLMQKEPANQDEIPGQVIFIGFAEMPKTQSIKLAS